MLHTNLVKLIRQTFKKQGELLWLAKNKKPATSVSYYAAQVEAPRDYTATSACRMKPPLGPLPDRVGDEAFGGDSWTPEAPGSTTTPSAPMALGGSFRADPTRAKPLRSW